MSENRITDSQQESAQDTNQETTNQESAEVTDPAELSAIPEKFVGKSPFEIIQAYNNLEKHSSKVSSERSEERKKREDLESKYKDLEARLSTFQSQPAPQAESSKAEEDPFAEYEEQFDANPKEAIKGIVKKVRQEVLSDSERRQMYEEQVRASEFHRSQKSANPEYAKLEPTMRELANEFGDLVSPTKASSVKALKLLHLAAKGARMEDYVSEAASKAKKESQSVRDEKRSAFSESSNSGKADNTKQFADLSLDEMEKLLGRSRN